MALLPRLFLLAMILTFATPALAIDTERMVGRQPIAKPPVEQKDSTSPPVPRQDEERTATSKKKEPVKRPTHTSGKKTEPVSQPPGKEPAPPVVSTPQPQIGTTMDRKAMESLGPLTNPLEGGLGNDMWDGTSRSLVQELIPALPVGNTLRPVQLLARRILLSNGDVSMMRNDTPVEGNANVDLFTLRLEKLLALGSYSDAVSLYTLIQGEPSHDRLAQAGIMALMSSGFPAQACLEVRATHHVAPEPASEDEIKGKNLFWDQVSAACDFIQMESIKAIREPGAQKTYPAKQFDQSKITGVPGSKVLTTLVSRADYRHVVSSPADLNDLSALERSVIRGMKRFDYTRLKLKKIRSIPAPALMLMAGDPNMPDNPRAALNIEAARRGLIGTDQLGRFYEELAKKNETANDDDSEKKAFSARLWDRYLAAQKAQQPSERAAIILPILENQVPGLPVALLPFASMVASANPATLSPNGIKNGLVLMLYGDVLPPERWVRAWTATRAADSPESHESVLLYLANLVPEILPTDSKSFPNDLLQAFFAPPKPSESSESLAIWELFSGLGRQNALYGITDREFYENDLDLTRFNDYVMPTEGFTEKLLDASQNDRLGETALLAAVALSEYNIGKTHPVVLREVLQNLETVGLKEEAQHMALGVILGLKQ